MSVNIAKMTGQKLQELNRFQARYLMSALALQSASPKDASIIFGHKTSYKKYTPQQKVMNNALFQQGKNLPKDQKHNILSYVQNPQVSQASTKNDLLIKTIKSYLPKHYQVTTPLHNKPHAVPLFKKELNHAINKLNRYELKRTLWQVAPQRPSFKQKKKIYQQDNQELAKKYKNSLMQGVMTNSELKFNGKNYFNQMLRTLRFHPNIQQKIKNPQTKLSDKDVPAYQHLQNVAQNVTIGTDGHTKIPNGKPLDNEQKQVIHDYVKITPQQVFTRGLLNTHLWHLKKTQQQKKRTEAQQTKQKLQKAEKDGKFKQQSVITMDWYHKLSQPGKKYLKINLQTAAQHPKSYWFSMKTYKKYIPRDIKYPFKQLKQLETGKAKMFGKPFHVPVVPKDEKSTINKFMTDKRNRLYILSGEAIQPINKYDNKYSPKNINQEVKTQTPKASPETVEDIRHFFLNIKPRTRRYFTRLATYADRDLVGTRRLLYTKKVAKEQLNSTEQYKRAHLKQMETGKTSDGRQTGTPLPENEVQGIKASFFDPQMQKLWGNGTFKKIADNLNNGDHSIDKQVKETLNSQPLDDKGNYKQLKKGVKFYDSLDSQDKNYMIQALQKYTLDPTSFERMFVANMTSNPKQKKALSVSERNQWKKLQGIPQGLSPDSEGNMVPTGQPSKNKDRYRVDLFLANPKNQQLIRNGTMNQALNKHQAIQQDAQQNPNGLIKLGAHLQQFGNILGGGRGMMLQSLHMPSRMHRFSKPRIGGYSQMLKHDRMKDRPGMDR